MPLRRYAARAPTPRAIAPSAEGRPSDLQAVGTLSWCSRARRDGAHRPARRSGRSRGSCSLLLALVRDHGDRFDRFAQVLVATDVCLRRTRTPYLGTTSGRTTRNRRLRTIPLLFLHQCHGTLLDRRMKLVRRLGSTRTLHAQIILKGQYAPGSSRSQSCGMHAIAARPKKRSSVLPMPHIVVLRQNVRCIHQRPG